MGYVSFREGNWVGMDWMGMRHWNGLDVNVTWIN